MGSVTSKYWNYEKDGMSISIDPNNPLVKKIKKLKDEMTGWERVKMIFETDDMGDITPELTRIRDGTLIGFFVGAMIGAFGRSRIAYMDFFRSNYHEAFETPLKAKSALQEKVTMGMISGGFRVGWRVGAFTGIYMLTSTCIAQYRNKIGILDQVGAGATAGFLYKFREGPKSMVAGTGLGSFLGLLAGVTTISVIKLTGLKPEEANIWYYQNIERRKERQQEFFRKNRGEMGGEDNLLAFHQNFMKPEASLDTVEEVDKQYNTLSVNKTDTPAETPTSGAETTEVIREEKTDAPAKSVNADKHVLSAKTIVISSSNNPVAVVENRS